MRLLVLLVFCLSLPLISGEAARQCLCKPYEKCLKVAKDKPLEQCFSKCQKFQPGKFVPCMKKLIPTFNRIKECSFSTINGFSGCTSQKSNVLSARSISDFRDFVIVTLEDKLEIYDENRKWTSDQAAEQAECVFECIHPGRNACTRRMKCDIFLPPEEFFFPTFLECAKERNFFKKSKQMYDCFSELLTTDEEQEAIKRASKK